MKKNNKKGFTIVELVIVIAVIAILAAVLIPTFANVIEKANINAAMNNARNAYTTWLADGKNAETIGEDYDFTIKSGDYFFAVVDGQFQSDATVTGTPLATVEDGTLTGITVVDGEVTAVVAP